MLSVRIAACRVVRHLPDASFAIAAIAASVTGVSLCPALIRKHDVSLRDGEKTGLGRMPIPALSA
jgi:hypothetical protein